MSTRLATQRNFVISTRASTAAAAIAAATATVAAASSTTVAATIATGSSSAVAVAGAGATNAAIVTVAGGESNLADSNDVVYQSPQPASPHAKHEEQHFEFSADDAVVVAATLEDVMTQKKLTNAIAGSEPQVEVIRVVVPMDADSSNDTNNINTATMPGLSAIKDDDVELAQQVANGQVTVLQAQSTDGEDGTPQFITVTVSAQDASHNYQVQYVDTELYHSNSSQTQMTYPFCPVGDYQTNGQTYYSTTSTGNYAAVGTNTSTGHATTTLPYLVPVDESLLLNGSSQSHSRDSPHSLTQEVAYIQEAQSTPQTPTSTTTATNSISGGSIGTGGGGASPDSEQSPLGSSTNKIASATIKWLSRNYETADGVSLPRSTLYNHYIQHCNEQKLEPVNAASFGKLIRSVFSGLRTRRLGTRGNSKYHYYGIRIKPGSHLNQSMDEKPVNGAYASQNISGGSAAGVIITGHAGSMAQHSGVSSSAVGNGSNGINVTGGGLGHRSAKKHSLKPETYEACIQYIGNGNGALPNIFPPIELNTAFSSELTLEDFETFRAMYRDHCESFLDAVLNLEFGTIEFILREFWRISDNNNLDDCETEEEKYLSKTKLYLLCHCAEVQTFVKEVDYQFYQNMVDVIIPDVLRSIPNALTQAIRNFAKNLEIWLCETTVGAPERMVQIKTSGVSAFCQTLRRYTSLNHLAQAARAVLQNSAQITQMLSDLNRVDFHNVQEQAAWVSQCEPSIVQRLESDFKAALQQQSSLEQWASWLQLVVESALEEYRGKPTYAKAARQFLLKWSFYSSMIIRDLTLRSASSFGSFHLIRLLFDEYMFYLVEHKIAEAQQKTAIAVICERMQKDIDFEFECQFEYISNEQQQEHRASTASIGGEAKRLKQE